MPQELIVGLIAGVGISLLALSAASVYAQALYVLGAFWTYYVTVSNDIMIERECVEFGFRWPAAVAYCMFDAAVGQTLPFFTAYEAAKNAEIATAASEEWLQ